LLLLLLLLLLPVLLIAALLLGISGSAVLRYVAASFFVVAYVRVDLAVQVGDAERVSRWWGSSLMTEYGGYSPPSPSRSLPDS
ncbi:MAG: hypothetical protein WKF65_17990, partial [Gaiellaceae bacterium]